MMARASQLESGSDGSPRRLLAWYEARARDLPWRRTRDPYRIWVSEIMLQQTRVTTVIPYYQRFLDRFPDVAALAAADVDEVLALWSGLGYYRRARQLHAAARAVVADGGEVPSTADELRRLPGIGPYTAAAVASIAFGECEPVLDGNVVRLLTRYLAEEGDPRRAATRGRLLEAARALLDPRRPGDGNQALMELGATLCRPRRPLCQECPLLPGCEAAAAGNPEAYPTPIEQRAAVREERVAVRVVDGRGRVLLFRRPDDSELLAGTWELPWAPRSTDEESAAALSARYGGRWRLGETRGRVRHGITYRRLEVELREAWWRGDEPGGVGDEPGGVGAVAEGPEAGWFDPGELDAHPMSALVTKLLALG